MALINRLGGSTWWNGWLSVLDGVALSAWNTQSLSISKSMPFLKINIRLFLNRSQLRYPLAAFVTNLIITLQFSDSALLILFCSTVISPVSFETIQQWLYACFKTKWSEFHSYNPERHLYLNEEHKCTVIILYFNNTVYLLS